jgi:hypothetical protein
MHGGDVLAKAMRWRMATGAVRASQARQHAVITPPRVGATLAHAAVRVAIIPLLPLS